MEKDACYQLGYIAKPHGVSGEVSAVFDVDFPENYKKLESVFVDVNNRLIPFFIEQITIAKNKAIIKFEDVDSAVQALELQSSTLYLPVDSLPPLTEDQFYFHEVIGFRVIDSNLGELGTIETFYNLPHQDLLAMSYKEKEVLIPVNDQIVKSVKRENKQLIVELPEGLLQVYLED
jgi:16S rRNA processing protein RimM